MTDDQITLDFPNSPDHMRLVRLVAADAGSRAGFDYEEIDDVKLALTELCSLFIADDPAVVRLAFTTDDRGLTVEGRVPRQAAAAAEFSEKIVAALVDEHEVRRSEELSSFRIRKNARPK